MQPTTQPNDFFSSEEFNQKLDKLLQLAVPAGSTDHKLYKELFLTTLSIAQSGHSHWDAKLAKRALEEMQHGFSLLKHFKHRRKVSVFGSARTPVESPLYQQAKTLGHELAKKDFMVITGAGGGIMAAAHEGAGTENALGLNIKLPFEQSANETVENTDSLLTFHYFFIRKLFFVKESHAVVLCPGGFGTWDEASEVLTLIQTGKTPLVPVILLDTPESTYWKQSLQLFNDQLKDNHYISPEDMSLMTHVQSVPEALQEIDQFYANYHSNRWFKNTFAIRMKHPLNEAGLAHIKQHFASLCLQGDFKQQPYQADFREAEYEQYTYLLFDFNSKHYGQLRLLVNALNLPEYWR